MLKITLRREEDLPLYGQIRDQIIGLIEKDVLGEGMRLPSSRDLAGELGIDRSTVTRAYRELWSLGFLDSRPGSYSTVRCRPAPAAEGPLQSPAWIAGLPSMKAHPLPKEHRNGIRYDFRSFSPDPSVLPVQEFRRCYADVMKEKGDRLLGYGSPGGYPPLLDYIAGMMSSGGRKAGTEELMITGGAQNALDLLCRLFRRDKWTVLVEEPGYSEALALFRSHGARVHGCPLDEDGPDIRVLRRIFARSRPAFFLTIPNLQNPTGLSSSLTRREEILALCGEYGVPLIEDGYAQDMRGTLLSIKSMDRRGDVIYLGTFSKLLSPGLRTGWIYADRALIGRLKQLQYISRVSENSSIQAALERFCRLGYYDLQLKRVYRLYKKRMVGALAALERCLPPSLGSFTRPEGGYYLWIRLSEGFPPEDKVHRRLLEEGIAVKPGAPCMVRPSSRACFRLSIAHMEEDEIEAGIEALCDYLNRIYRDRDRKREKGNGDWNG